MALSYRRPSLFWEPTSVCGSCVSACVHICAQTCAFVYVYMQRRNTVGAHFWCGTREPPSSLCSSLSASIFPERPPPSNLSQLTHNMTTLHGDNQQIAQSRWKSYQIYPHSNTNTKRHAHAAANKVRSRVLGQDIAQRTAGRIPFHLSDPYVSYLEGCNGTQLGWNQDELIN